jgi:hypothetical protein
MRRLLLPLLSLLLAAPALADAPPATPGTAGPASGESETRVGDKIPDEPDIKEAQKVLTQYLDLVTKKKWKDAAKLVHPKTTEVIAGIKKRIGKEQHPMAPQYWAKDDFFLKEYKLENAGRHLYGTIAFDTLEKNFRVQEKGLDAEGEQTSYLLGKKGGKWLVVDKKNNNTFDDRSIKFEYRGYFDDAPRKEAAEDGK